MATAEVVASSMAAMNEWTDAGTDAVGALYALLLGGDPVPLHLRVAAFTLLSSSAGLPAAVTIPGWTSDLQVHALRAKMCTSDGRQ